MINEDCDLSIDPTTLANDYHDIDPIETQNGILNHLGYLPTVNEFTEVPGSSEMRAVIVDYIRHNNIRRPQYNIDRNNDLTLQNYFLFPSRSTDVYIFKPFHQKFFSCIHQKYN